MKKRILLVLTIAAALACLFALCVSAVNIGGLEYSLNGTTMEAALTSANQGCTLTTVVIPSTVEHEGNVYTVTRIDSTAFKGNTSIVTLTTPSTIKHIGTHAFREMTKLEEITLNTSAEFTKFEDAEVYSCKALKKADLSGMVGLVDMGGGSTYDHTFTSCSSLTEVILPESLLIIGTNAFNGCASLAHIDLPKNLTTIRSNAFTSCAFTTIEIPKTVTYIGDYAFQGCKNLESLDIPVGVTYFGCNNFQYTKVTKVVLPSTVTGAGKDVFHGLSTLKTLVIGCADLSSYSGSFLSGCGSITTLFYGGSDPSGLTDKYTGFKSYEPVTYEQYIENLRNPEFEGYAGKILVYGIETCASCGDVDTAEYGFIFEDLLSEMYMGAACENCGAKAVSTTYAPVFVDLGYSTSNIGGKCSILQGFKVNYASIDVYNEQFSDATIGEFGVLAVAANRVDGVAFGEGLVALDGVQSYALASSFNYFDVKINNIPVEGMLDENTAFLDAKLHLCAYAVVGEEVYYISENHVGLTLGNPVSYNDKAE